MTGENLDDELIGAADSVDDLQAPPPPEHAALVTVEEGVTQGKFDNWPVWTAAVCTFSSGLVGAVQPLFVRLSQHAKFFDAVLPYDLYHLNKSLTVMLGFLLMYLSINIFRRKKVAWMVALAFTALSAVLHVLLIGTERLPFIAEADPGQSLPAYTCIPSIVSAIFLWVFRTKFTVESEVATIAGAFEKIAMSAAIAVAYGTIGFWLIERKDFAMQFSLADCFLSAVRQLTFTGSADLVAHTRYAGWFLESLHLYSGLTIAAASYSLFRPIAYELNTRPQEHALAKEILEREGRTALDHYKLLDDKSYFFSSDRRSFIAYKTALSVAVSLGDPAGPAGDLAALTQKFREHCHNNGWTIALLQVTPDFIAMYRSLGLSVLKVGEEAVIDLDAFTAATIKKKSFKSSLKKFEKDGFKVDVLKPPHSTASLDALQVVSDQWLSLPGRRERGFSLGQFDRLTLQEDTVYTLSDPQGKIMAFVNEARSYRTGEVSADMMRHVKDAPNGSMDFLFAKMLINLKERGFKLFNLGLAALSGVGDKPGASLEERAVHQIYQHLNRFFSYKGLRQYKQKFDPNWEESFLIYEGGPPGLVRTAIALARATEE